ncbi:hypothetical protein JOC37_002614 [Desulfohalotomaculum tongense]|nr:hypothetical protein [Desulforadius tongensis]MBM7856181.1 hypothetical protein [Desulforadius tongensis]
MEDLKNLAQEVLGCIDDLDQEDKKHLVILLIDRIIISKNEVLIKAKIPQ